MCTGLGKPFKSRKHVLNFWENIFKNLFNTFFLASLSGTLIVHIFYFLGWSFTICIAHLLLFIFLFFAYFLEISLKTILESY